MGGISWDGFDYAATYFGVDDIEGLIDRLYVIKTHVPPKESE